MKINKADRILQVYKDMNSKKVGPKKGAGRKDELEVSEKALDYQFAIGKFKELPEIRMDKINRIKKEVESGTYTIDGRKIAEKIYENANFDRKV